MKSGAFAAGQHDLKGKKVARLGCGCCTMINFKEKYAALLAKREMRGY